MSLGQNVLKLTTGRIAAAAVLFVTTPIIARMFLPEDFGIQEVFMAIMGVLGTVACLRYELSISLGRSDEEASASFALSAMLCVVFALIILVIVYFTRSYVAAKFRSPALATYLWLLPIAIVMDGLRQALLYWMGYKERFGTIAWSGLAKALIAGLTPIVWYFAYGRSAAALLAAIFTGGVVAVLILLIPSFSSLVVSIKDGGFRSVIRIARHHRKFPIYHAWSGLVNTLSARMPTFFLGMYFPTKIVGYYALGNRIITLPTSLLSASIHQVLYPAAGKEYNRTGDISEIIHSIVRRLAQIGIFPMVAIGFCGASLFGFLFGKEWVEAGIYAQILSIFVLFQFITSPVTAVFSIKSYQEKGLIYNASLAVSRFIALLLTGRLNNPRFTLGAYAIASFVVYLLAYAWLLKLSNVSVLWGLKIILKYVLGSVMLLLPTLFLIHARYSILIILISLLLATALYLLILCKVDTTIQTAISTVLHRRHY